MYIAIDVGSTTIKVANFAKKSLPKTICKEIPNSGDYSKDIEGIETMINKLSNNQQIEGIGICIPGIISENKDTVKLASNIKHWVDKPIKQMLEEKYLTKVTLDNDALAATTAEAFFGNYVSNNFLYVQWGTGVGGSYVMRNTQTNTLQILPSELGHQIIKLDGEKCGCGQKGCLELYVSGGNFLKQYGTTAENLSELNWETILRTMAHGLVNALNIYEVPLIVLGGTVAIEQKAKIESLDNLVEEYFRGPKKVSVILSSLGRDAGVVGALSLLIQ